jgi:proteasome lid subunit RPN8/RPN11
MNLLRRQRPKRRSLVFSPLAWLKLQYLCHVGPTEVGAFAISAPEHPLYVTDMVTVQQETTMASVNFADKAVADYFDHCVDQGLKPAQFARIWVHSHPGASALPSGTDEETFRRVFGNTDWAVMAILSREGHSYARLQVNNGPGARCRLRWRVDWESWPQELSENSLADHRDAWHQEYEQNVLPQVLPDYIRPRSFKRPELITDTSQLQELDHWYGDESFWTSLGESIHEHPVP